MLAVLLVLLLIGAWIFSEVTNARVLIRVSLGGISGLSLAASVLAFQTVLTGFDATLHANNATKNLARGLVGITAGEIDQERLREDLQQLDRGIVPSYNDYHSAQDAVAHFLHKYGIDYIREMPIEQGANKGAGAQ